VSRITQIQALVRNGLYYLTEHADDEAMQDEFDIYDIENGILSGRIRKSWPKDGKLRSSASRWMDAKSALFAALQQAVKSV